MAKTRITVQIGTRLRELRTLAGLSQRELARRGGVTNGTISLIEVNKLNPTVATLKRILDVIPISLTEFFGDKVSSGEQLFFKSHELLELTEGKIAIRQVGKNLKGRSLQVCHEHYKPGADTGPRMFKHEGEEGGIVIQGKIEITVGDQTAVLSAGDAYHFRSNRPHRMRNKGKRDCIIVSAITPPTF